MPIMPLPAVSATEQQRKKAAQEATASIENLLRDGALFHEVYKAIADHLAKTRGVHISQTHPRNYWHVWRDGITLFKSQSYTACVEYALALPIPVAE